MLISDWSSDVCSSDLAAGLLEAAVEPAEEAREPAGAAVVVLALLQRLEHGRAQRRGQDDGNDHRQCHRRDDRDGELPVDNAGGAERTSARWGKSVHGRVDLGGGRLIKKKTRKKKN